ncbi:MAG: glutathione peroxidase [Verrucomicrobiales bacterium]|nr:glutathione peroxidase [Verrucomicrobiales bacterium]
MKTRILATLLALSIPAFAAEKKKAESVHDFTVENIAGEKVDLADYKGKVLLIVNVASKCGVTYHYDGMQRLHQYFGEKGLVVMGFPANNFGGQEPGTNDEIAKFCKSNHGVTFPMFAKVSAKGEDQAPLFKFLTTSKNPDLEGDIGWNFEKFLVGKNGKLLRRFDSNTEPDDPEVVKAIEAALAEKG